MTEAGDRLIRMLGYLGADPDNGALLVDATQAAIDANDFETATALVARLRAVRLGSVEAEYLAASIEMKRGDFAGAAALLRPLAATAGSPNIRFNLAWSEAMIGEKAAALDLLDEATTGTIAAAAMLRTQLLHEAGAFDAALSFGKSALASFPEDPGLLAAMATLALDSEDVALARRCALKAGDHPEALAAAGVLDLHDGDTASARLRFGRSIALREHNPRAWIGRGLAALAERDTPGAAQDIDRGAQQFGDHIGSWIAAGWAHYLSGDVAAAHQRFERALAIDPTFAESHGSLAVIDIARGDLDTARRRMVTALRLDRDCFSAALAQVLMTSGDPDSARAIVEKALATPLNENGLTIASYLAGLSRPTIH